MKVAKSQLDFIDKRQEVNLLDKQCRTGSDCPWSALFASILTLVNNGSKYMKQAR